MTQEMFYQRIADSLNNIDRNIAILLQNLVSSSVSAEDRVFVERAELDSRLARAEFEKKKLEVESSNLQKDVESLRKQ